MGYIDPSFQPLSSPSDGARERQASLCHSRCRRVRARQNITHKVVQHNVVCDGQVSMEEVHRLCGIGVKTEVEGFVEHAEKVWLPIYVSTSTHERGPATLGCLK